MVVFYAKYLISNFNIMDPPDEETENCGYQAYCRESESGEGILLVLVVSPIINPFVMVPACGLIRMKRLGVGR